MVVSHLKLFDRLVDVSNNVAAGEAYTYLVFDILGRSPRPFRDHNLLVFSNIGKCVDGNR